MSETGLGPTFTSPIFASFCTSSKTNKAKDDLKDVRVLTFFASGTWQRRDIAKSLGNGMYEVNLNLPESGVYRVFVESGSMESVIRTCRA